MEEVRGQVWGIDSPPPLGDRVSPAVLAMPASLWPPDLLTHELQSSQFFRVQFPSQGKVLRLKRLTTASHSLGGF